jgi:hypothetical protein
MVYARKRMQTLLEAAGLDAHLISPALTSHARGSIERAWRNRQPSRFDLSQCCSRGEAIFRR